MIHGTSKPSSLKARRYNACLIDINKYLAVFPGAKASEKSCETEWNEILLNIMSNIWINQAYIQGFDYEPIHFKADVNMFERM